MKTFAPTFNSKHFARPPVSVCQFIPTLSKYSRLKRAFTISWDIIKCIYSGQFTLQYVKYPVIVENIWLIFWKFINLGFSFCCTSTSISPILILFKSLINSASPFCLITSDNLANWNIFHKCKLKSLSILSYFSIEAYTTVGSCRKSSKSTTVSLANATDTVHKKSLAILHRLEQLGQLKYLTPHQLISSLSLITCFLYLLSFYKINKEISDPIYFKTWMNYRPTYICCPSNRSSHGFSGSLPC